MDDELGALFGDSPSEDEPFADFADPADLGFGDSGVAGAGASEDFGAAFFDDFDSGVEEAAAKPSRGKKRGRPKQRRAGGGAGFLGLTPQQRMVLSIFLFLDVSVLGCLILVAIGAVNF